MGYELKPGVTGNISQGGEYDNLDSVDSVNYSNLSAENAAAAALSANAAAASAESAAASAASIDITGILYKSNNLSDLPNKILARSNLGLGTAATLSAGEANGVATLDSTGLIPLYQIPPSIKGGVIYQGTWNATTNTPTITSGIGAKGYYYVVAVAGSTNVNGITDWKIGDWVIFNGTAWEKVDNTDAVTSVNGYTGTVSLNYNDVGAANSGTNTNITALSGIAGGISTADFLQLDTGITPTTAVGKFQWDPTWGGPQVGMVGGNVNLQIGQETLIYVYNNTGSALTDGQIVYVTGSTNVNGITDWKIGDWVIFNGTAWEKVEPELSIVVNVASPIKHNSASINGITTVVP